MRADFAVLAFAAISGCWREAPAPTRPAPKRAEPEHGRTSSRHRPLPRWRQTARTEQTLPPDPARSPYEIAQLLATDLRASATQLLPSYVAGPVVVLDLDAAALTTECDAAAVTGAQQWGAMLSDPARPRAHCRGGQSFTCSQFASNQILIIELADPDQWRIVSVIIGNFRTGRTTMNAKMGLMRSQIANATCP
jgi:hypothetical protein